MGEHCLECVLSLVEMVQFKTMIYAQMAQTQNAECEDLDLEAEMAKCLVLPPSCPQSGIVRDVSLSAKMKARELFLKYVRSGSEFEVNLRFKDRRRYSRLMEN